MSRLPPTLVSAEDFRRAARRRLPRLFFDYIDGAAGSETTAAANLRALAALGLQQRTLRDVSRVTTAATFLGGHFALPLGLGPIGSLGMFRVGAEASAIRVAHRLGIPVCLSSFAMTAPEALPEPPRPGDAWQLYVLKDRGRTEALLERLQAAGFDTLFVTVDTAVSGLRERDLRNGLRRVSRPGARMLWDFASHPRWLADLARLWPPQMGLARDWPEAGASYLAQSGFLAGQIDPGFDRRGLEWLRGRWPGRLVVKGVLHPEDARACAGAGAEAVVVSNHGGRQLDGAPASIAALPGIVQAVGDRTEVLFDSGIRRGSDVVKALALGAKGCLLGRAYAFALAAGSEAGLLALLGHLQQEIALTLALMGKTAPHELTPDDVIPALPRPPGP